MNSNMKHPVFNSNGRVVGHIEDSTLFKAAIASKHMLRNPRGWASDVVILEEAERLKATQFVIVDRETKTKYTADIQAFWDYGIAFERKHGEQIVLPIKFWRVDRLGFASEPPQLPPTPEPIEPAEVQLSMHL